jgi:hypothetical protein
MRMFRPAFCSMPALVSARPKCGTRATPFRPWTCLLASSLDGRHFASAFSRYSSQAGLLESMHSNSRQQVVIYGSKLVGKP